ncbi:MAG: hypothetical protein V9E94_06340 [Microthrixaceae bacterium]
MVELCQVGQRGAGPADWRRCYVWRSPERAVRIGASAARSALLRRVPERRTVAVPLVVDPGHPAVIEVSADDRPPGPRPVGWGRWSGHRRDSTSGERRPAGSWHAWGGRGGGQMAT